MPFNRVKIDYLINVHKMFEITLLFSLNALWPMSIEI